MGLDINKLIEVAESIINDDQVGAAAKITKPVQILKDEQDHEYQLQVVLVCEKEKFLIADNEPIS